MPGEEGKSKWSTFFATEHWAALVDDDDWGLGVIHPGVVRFIGGFHGKANTGGLEDGPTAPQTGVQAVAKREIDDTVLAPEGDGRLGPVRRERVQP